eukprot:CAMPEP_0116146204 /NCGR_PEP_ID=MMETSP0329-20121206/17038_1 /TAXON_ID=697910 /ORGANISM="Pseudo-nitzschia arenysensis, Strain B593" /LENGTH=875 /DNA_ID=CAMNT_0003641933 /DNA_START=172 /DNA_END=2799 /DNA_ORIENTATION=-
MVSPAQRSPAAASPPPPSNLLPQRRTRSSTSLSDQINNNNNNNNNNSNQDLQSPSRNSTSGNSNNLQMERVTFHLHSRLCNFGLAHTTSRTRNLLEHVLLVIAICCACALLMLHRTFVAAPSCLDNIEGFDPSRANLTHLVILPHNMTTSKSRIEQKSTVVWNRKDPRRIQNLECLNPNGLDSPTMESCSAKESVSNTISNDDAIANYYEEWLQDQLTSNTLPISYSYSNTKAYLMLPYDHFWLQNGMDVQFILLSPSDPVCFGEPFVQFLLWNCFIGGNTVLLNWLLTFPTYEQSSTLQKGHVYNPRTEWFWEFSGDRRHQAAKTSSTQKTKQEKLHKLLAKLGVFFRTSFLFFFCTTLVSFTLRETQERMLDFTRELSRRVRQSISVSDLITTHLVQNLVFVPIMLGMMFFLIEFYNGDKFLAFSITSIVWSVEGFSLVCLRSSQGLSYFPYFFFLLFLLFHVYQTAFSDHGFVYLALTVVWCFMLHSMVFFWHRYELPALVRGHVSVHRPRMIGSILQQQQQQQHDEDGSEYNSTNNNSENRSSLHRATTAGTSNTTTRHEQQRHSTRTASIDGSHLTTPLLTAAQTATATTTTAPLTAGARTSSSSHLSANGGIISSRQSFLSTSASSRRTSGLYRLNQEDDNSTGSHLYFMGGEVVVHQQRTSTNQNGHSNSRDLSPPTIRRGNSIESISESAAQQDAPASSFIRNESNFSLLSSASDAYGSASNGMNNHTNSNVGLDVTGRWSGEAEDEGFASNINPSSYCETLPNDTSMDTVHVSNVSTPQKQQPQQHNGTENAANQANTDGYYAHESGGLQAIFESKLTPRHRNTIQQDSTSVDSIQPSISSHSSSSTSELQYQRRPPTFPELTPSS